MLLKKYSFAYVSGWHACNFSQFAKRLSCKYHSFKGSELLRSLLSLNILFPVMALKMFQFVLFFWGGGVVRLGVVRLESCLTSSKFVLMLISAKTVSRS